MKVIASGKFDIREYVARYKPPPVSEISKIFLIKDLLLTQSTETR